MMMADDKKKQSTLIIAKMSKEKPESESPEAPDMADSGLEFAAEEVIKAVEAKDSRALMEAMKSFHNMCADMSGDDSEMSSDEASEMPEES